MKIDVSVKNLGRLKEGTIKIRPITLLTGPNGTGKSFFTKSLYSIFNVINKNVYHVSISKKIRDINLLLDGYIYSLSYAGERDEIAIFSLKRKLKEIQSELNHASELKIQEYLNFAKSQANTVDELENYFDNYLLTLKGKLTKKRSIESQSNTLKKLFSSLKNKLNDSLENYQDALSENLNDEIKDNFQITDLSELVTFDNDKTEIDIDELIHIEFGKGGVGFSLGHDFINEISSLSRVVFFESPAYWKVREALISAKENLNRPVFLGKTSNKILTGVPKYFYDLNDALKTSVKDNTSEEIIELTNSIENSLGGKFIFSGDSLVYKDNKTGKEVSKNLISFGMTNLGMIHSLLSNNIITPGSFVFIDEPETNLHPDWQVLLMEVLIKLAKSEVNIVIATHSIDMLKALEVGIKKQKNKIDDDFMSIQFLDTDGQLLEFDSDASLEQLKEANHMLTASYEKLYFQGCSID